jgi:hypothetical protein
MGVIDIVAFYLHITGHRYKLSTPIGDMEKFLPSRSRDPGVVEDLWIYSLLCGNGPSVA